MITNRIYNKVITMLSMLRAICTINAKECWTEKRVWRNSSPTNVNLHRFEETITRIIVNDISLFFGESH